MSVQPRTRLSPDARKKQLLATAKEMIASEGLQRFTMEALARSAGVSTPLVYNYYSSRQTLLRALLEYEYRTYADKLTEAVSAAESFEEIVRVFITSNFDHHSPGNIMPILASQPEIAEVIQSTRAAGGRRIARFLIDNAAESYRLDRTRAELVVSMSSGASIAAAEYTTRGRIARKEAIETALAYVLAGLERVATHADSPSASRSQGESPRRRKRSRDRNT